MSTDSASLLTQKFDPQTGEYGWEVQDESYDYHQEIARSSFADMLHDHERNDKYYQAIKVVIDQKHKEGKKAHVLDIGTGTGLLAMMAACCGADTIHACEAFSPISKCAEKVIAENGLADRITVIHKRSTDLTVKDESHPESRDGGDGSVRDGDLPQRCNILVTEVFDTELIGEGAVRTFNHALTNLLERDCLVVPSRATVYAQVVESEWMQRWNKLTPWGDIAPSETIQQCPGAAAVHDLQLSQLRREDFRVITPPEPVFRFDWTGKSPIPLNDNTSVTTTALVSGTAHMVFMWWSLDMDPQGKIVLSCAPWWAHPSAPLTPQDIPWRDHWLQAVYYLPSPLTVTQEQPLRLLSSRDEFSLWFNLYESSWTKDILEKCLEKLMPFTLSDEMTKRPVCNCMLHVVCSRTHIAMINDPRRRDKYLKVLERLVNQNSIVLSIGGMSLLGLQAACLGAKKVYHIEKNAQSYEVMDKLIKDNNLSSKITLLKVGSYLDNILNAETAKSVNLVVGEPLGPECLFPWNVVKWWALKKQYPNADGMLQSATLYAMPMQFDHLHKIRAPLNTISGFTMTSFDELIQGSSSVSDSDVEVQPLWEYPGISLGEPVEIYTLDEKTKNFVSQGNMLFKVPGTFNGVALWVDLHLDPDTTITSGPLEPVIPGSYVRWDPYTRQTVYFIMPQVPITEGDFMLYKVVTDLTGATTVDFRVLSNVLTI